MRSYYSALCKIPKEHRYVLALFRNLKPSHPKEGSYCWRVGRWEKLCNLLRLKHNPFPRRTVIHAGISSMPTAPNSHNMFWLLRNWGVNFTFHVAEELQETRIRFNFYLFFKCWMYLFSNSESNYFNFQQHQHHSSIASGMIPLFLELSHLFNRNLYTRFETLSSGMAQ